MLKKNRRFGTGERPLSIHAFWCTSELVSALVGTAIEWVSSTNLKMKEHFYIHSFTVSVQLEPADVLTHEQCQVHNLLILGTNQLHNWYLQSAQQLHNHTLLKIGFLSVWFFLPCVWILRYSQTTAGQKASLLRHQICIKTFLCKLNHWVLLFFLFQGLSERNYMIQSLVITLYLFWMWEK